MTPEPIELTLEDLDRLWADENDVAFCQFLRDAGHVFDPEIIEEVEE